MTLRLHTPIKPPRIPKALIYETLNGKPLPYKGYREVLSNNKLISEIMGCSSIQAILSVLISSFLFNNINRKKYLIGSNESGLHLNSRNNLSNDIAIFNREGLVLNHKYFDIAPKIVIEIDVRVDTDTERYQSDTDYLIEKSNKMLHFGTEKVVWILTANRTVMVFSKSEPSVILSFDDDIAILDTCVLNISKLLHEDEIEF